MTRTISFTLNGEPVAAEIKPHHNCLLYTSDAADE